VTRSSRPQAAHPRHCIVHRALLRSRLRIAAVGTVLFAACPSRTPVQIVPARCADPLVALSTPPVGVRPEPVLALGKQSRIVSLAFSARGDFLASGGMDGTVIVWDLAEQAPRMVLDAVNVPAVGGLAFSPDDGILAVGGSGAGGAAVGRLRLDTHAWLAPFRLPEQSFAARTCRVSFVGSSDSLVGVGTDGTVTAWTGAAGSPSSLWTAPNWKPGYPMPTSGPSPVGERTPEGSVPPAKAGRDSAPPPTRGIRALAAQTRGFAWDARHAVMAYAAGPRVLELRDQTHVLRTLQGAPSEVVSIAFSADGTSVVAASPDEVVSWTVADGVRTGLPPPPPTSLQVELSPDGSLLAWTDRDGSVSVRQLDAATPPRRLAPPAIERLLKTDVLAFSPDGHRIAAAGDSYLEAWELPSGRPLLGVSPGLRDWAQVVAWSPDGTTLATGGSERKLRLWDIYGGRLRATETLAAPISNIAFIAGGETLAVASGRDVDLFDARTGTRGKHLAGVLAPPSNQLELVDLFASRPPTVTFGPTTGLFAVANTPGVGDLAVYSIEDGTPRWSHHAHAGSTLTLSLSPDGRLLASAGADHLVKLWDVSSGRARGPLPFASDDITTITALAFTPDGRYLIAGAVGTSGHAIVWDVWSGAEKTHLSNLFGAAALAPSPDGRQVAVVEARADLSGHAVLIFDLRTGALLDALAPTASIRPLLSSLAWSPDGRTVALGAADQLILARPGQRNLLHWYALRGRRADSLLLVTDSGFFDGEEDSFPALRYRSEMDCLRTELYSADRLQRVFRRPGLSALFVAGAELHKGSEPPAVGAPPQLSWVTAPPAMSTDERLSVQVEAREVGGGIGALRFFVNGARVDEDDGCIPAEASPGSAAVKRRTIALPLDDGANEIVVEAESVAGRVQSRPLRSSVKFTPPREAPLTAGSGRPRLILLELLLDRYQDAATRLSYAKTDGAAFATVLNAQKGALFEEVILKVLRDSEVTRSAVIAAVDEIVRAGVRPTDVLVVYGAGHAGIVDCGGDRPRYMFLTYPSSPRDEPSICSEGLSEAAFARLMHRIRVRKKLLVLDTCHAGSVATNEMLLAMRGSQVTDIIGQLAHAQGFAVLAAAKPERDAAEVPRLGHGLFTYVLLEGLAGGAARAPDGLVHVTDLAAYVGRVLPPLSEKEFNHPQVPIVAFAGDDFPLARAGRSTP
jgi:WD40 repeat protein